MNYSINTLFGEILIGVRTGAPSVTGSGTPNIFENAVKDKFSRESKVYEEIAENEKALLFLDYRPNYMNMRAAMQDTINDTTKNLIKTSMKEYMDRGYSAKESFEMARKEHKRAIDDGYSAMDRLTGLPNNFLKK